MPDGASAHQRRRNHLLASLPPDEFAELQPQLEPVDVAVKQTVIEPGQPIRYVYFPGDSVFSIVSTLDNGSVVEVATVGNEGMVGVPVFLGAETIPLTVFCQINGSTLRLRSEALRAHISAGGMLTSLLMRYTQVLLDQIAQTAACNRAHLVEQRCARWLLMTHDRVQADTFPMTHEFLAQMLGIRRASVSEVAAALQRDRLISYHRGIMTITDRPSLEDAACECYERLRKEHARLLGTSG